MADEIARLEQQLAQLRTAMDSLNGLSDAQAPLLAQIKEKTGALAKLRGEQSAVPSSPTATTTIHGSAGGNITSGPTISGSISAARDVNIATNQTIHNVDTRGGDYAEGNIYKD